MSTIVRIDIEPKGKGRRKARGTHGWQARAYVCRNYYLSKFFSDSKLGGTHIAEREAWAEAERLHVRARRLQRQLRKIFATKGS